jgi:lipopolysaccharide export system protein LptA
VPLPARFGRTPAWAAAAGVVAALALSLPSGGAAQQAPAGRCKLQFENTPGTRLNGSQLPSGQSNIFIGGGVVAYCVGQDVHLRSDSAEYYGDQGVLYLIANVHYREPRVAVDSRRMTYFRIEERLIAEGDVYAVLPSGTRMRGPRVEYFRAVPPIRSRTRTVATGRPTTTLVDKDTAGTKSQPTQLIADVVVNDADSVVYASGKVDVTRTDVNAHADSAVLDNSQEFARLLRKPRIEGTGDRPFTLVGKVIDLYSHQRQLERVVAQEGAHATSEDLDLTADTIDLRMSTGKLERAFVWGGGGEGGKGSRAHAVSPERDIVADSIEIVMPGQRVREVHALRRAFAQSSPDSLKIITAEKDWLRGDTLVAEFDTAATADTAARPRIRRIVATGRASSFYHLASRQGAAAPPSINYVRGRMIIVDFHEQEVQTVSVTDQAAGLYVEPVPDSTAVRAASDSTKRPATRPRPIVPAAKPPATRPPGTVPQAQ